MREQLLQLFGAAIPIDELTIERALVSFFARILEPSGAQAIQRAVQEFGNASAANRLEMERLLTEFRQLRWNRLDDYMDVLDHFFRAYDEFNQTFMYVRRDLGLPEDPYAPSTDFENTKLYYGEAFEVLGSSIDILAAANNVLSGRAFDRLNLITLQAYRGTDKGRRADTLAANAELSWLVSEYDNRLRNASHHRWLRLSNDRSELTYREGGNGNVVRLSYAEYLYRCCAITRQLMLLAAVESILLSE